MQAVKNRGLSGKHRLSHNRSRAARLHAQSLIEEFFEPEEMDSSGAQPIPIRRRSEFLPTVAKSTVAPIEFEPESWPGEPSDCSIERTDGDPSMAADDHNGDLPIARCKDAPTATNAVVCVDQIFLNQRPAMARNGQFTVRGFVRGCAIGAVVGSSVLVALRIAFG